MTRYCNNCKSEFTILSEDLSFYEKIDVPIPTLCPSCRYQRRIANRNEWNFYKRDCSLCKKSKVSIYNPSYPGPVYCQPCWWSDTWDPLSYERELDLTKPFFEQFYEHRYKVPRVALTNHNSVNSEYSNQSENNENCYMVVASNKSEDCMYGNWNQESRDCVDCWAMKECEIMYESLNCRKCYKCLFVENCADTNESFFCNDCRGCNNCFGCVGLRNKSYQWFNAELGKEEYEKRIKLFELTNLSIRELKEKLHELSIKIPLKFYHGNKNENSTGDYIEGTKNTKYAFNCRLSENLTYAQDAWEARDCLDLTETLDNELDYELEGAAYGSKCVVGSKSWYNHNALYSELNFNCNDIFGCVGLRKKSYCIFNKQYKEEDYKRLKTKLIEHMKITKEWGEFFPIRISPFPYNDSLAQDYFPLEKKDVEERGWHWHNRDIRDYKVTLEHRNLPKAITEVQDTILQEVIRCESEDSEKEKKLHLRCATAFRIHPMELAFYRRLLIPLPHKCFPCRLEERLAHRNPRKLHTRTCDCNGPSSKNKFYKNTRTHSHGNSPCSNILETTYSGNRPEIVYCESCYQSEIV